MSFIICTVAICPMRKEPAHRSEQVSQLLFGDVAQVIETTGDFVFVKHTFDDYNGWCQQNQLTPYNYNAKGQGTEIFTGAFLNAITINDNQMMLPFGCNVRPFLNTKATIPPYTITYANSLFERPEQETFGEMLYRVSLTYINTAYLWGGRSVFGIDCSGFTQAVYRFGGIRLLRDAHEQATQGQAVGFLEEVQCGDLAFFDNAEGKITHVGLLLDKQTIIHASGRVRIDAIDHYGIVNADNGTRTHQLRLIKRLL